MFKIAIDCHHLKDQKGIERYVLNLLKYWKKEREAEFILYFKEKPKFLKKEFKSPNFRVRVLKNPLKFSSTAFFQHLLLPVALWKDKADLLFSPSYLLPLWGGKKTAVTIHDIIYQAHPQWFTFRGWQDKILVKWAGRKTAERADVIFVPSEFTKKELLKFYKISPSKIKITPLAADDIFFLSQEAEKIKKVKQKYYLSGPYFIFAGALFPRRPIKKSLLAFQEIALKFPHLQYLIIGKDFTQEPPFLGDLIQKINRRLKRKAVIWHNGFVNKEELAALFQGAHASIYLSFYEGFGLPPLESMASGTPVICGNAQALKEITGGVCFWVKDPSGKKEIKEAMHECLYKKGKYQKIAREGLKRAKDFSWRKTAQETLRMLKFVIQKGS